MGATTQKARKKLFEDNLMVSDFMHMFGIAILTIEYFSVNHEDHSEQEIITFISPVLYSFLGSLHDINNSYY